MNGPSDKPACAAWRAFAFSLAALALAASPLSAQPSKRYRPQPNYAQLSVPDQAEGKSLLESIREMGISGDYYFEFELKLLPKRGEEITWKGELWGGRRGHDFLTRLQVTDPAGGKQEFLLKRGPASQAWSLGAGASGAVALDAAALFQPIRAKDGSADMILSPFDLLLSYFQWTDFKYEGLEKVRGRPAHRFLLYPPADIAAAQPALCGVRMSVDSAYKAMVESEFIGEGDSVERTFSLQELKKVGEQWIPKSIEVRDEATRSKVRLSVVAAALGLSFPARILSPEGLSEPISAPPAASVERF